MHDRVATYGDMAADRTGLIGLDVRDRQALDVRAPSKYDRGEICSLETPKPDAGPRTEANVANDSPVGRNAGRHTKAEWWRRWRVGASYHTNHVVPSRLLGRSCSPTRPAVLDEWRLFRYNRFTKSGILGTLRLTGARRVPFRLDGHIAGSRDAFSTDFP